MFGRREERKERIKKGTLDLSIRLNFESTSKLERFLEGFNPSHWLYIK